MGTVCARLILVPVVLAMLVAAAAAGPILYDEAISGDAPGSASSAVALGVLPLGDSDVLGSIAFFGPAEQDYYAFDVAPGTQSTASIVINSFGGGFLNIHLRDSSDNGIATDGFIGDQVSPIWVSSSPIAPGSYFMRFNGNADRKDYALTFNTTVPPPPPCGIPGTPSCQVPEPGTLALFGLSLAGIAVTRRWRLR